MASLPAIPSRFTRHLPQRFIIIPTHATTAKVASQVETKAETSVRLPEKKEPWRYK
jgi:hypothetical protein